MKNPYDVLGVRRNASPAEIELAFRGRRSQYHPDRYAGRDAETIRWATARMQEVNVAYALLSDVQQRARFDARHAHAVSDDDTGSDEAAKSEGESASAQGAASMSLREFLRQRFAPYSGFARTYFAPGIPLKKLSNALQSYGQGVRAEEVVALMDSTVFGGAKDGVMLTETQIRLMDLGSGLAIWEWPNIRSVDADRTEIYVKGHKLMDCLAVNEGEVGRLVGGLQEFLQLLGNARPGSKGESRAERPEEGTSSSSPAKYRDMYDMAKREFLHLGHKIQKLEFQLGKDFIDRRNAAEYFGYLERSLQEAGKAERAWAILGEIAMLSKAIIAFSDTGKVVPPVLAQRQDEDSQLVMELRALLRFLQEAVEMAERQARTQQFDRR